jgi:hypothetical protein
VAGKKLSKPVKVQLDPRIKISEAELAEQLKAGKEAGELATRVNRLVQRVDDLTNQLNALANRAPRGGPGVGEGEGGGQSVNPADLKTAQDDLKKLRAKLVRECNMGYRCPSKLREEVTSLMGGLNAGIGAPTDGQKTVLQELQAETAQAIAELSRITETSIKKLNEQLSSQPHIATGAPLK